MRNKKEWGRPASVIEYSMMISSYAKEFAVTKAADLFDEMVAEGHVPDLIAYISLIDVYAKVGMFEQAERAMNEAFDSGYSLDARIVNIMVWFGLGNDGGAHYIFVDPLLLLLMCCCCCLCISLRACSMHVFHIVYTCLRYLYVSVADSCRRQSHAARHCHAHFQTCDCQRHYSL
jgi:pentatricopeptide repeat protein